MTNILRIKAPQGLILSPLFFNLFLSKIKECAVKEAKFLQYANDIVIFAADSNPLDFP